ncbi:MAG: hypothetical protein ACREPD_16185 [Stenotrophomonas sp.]|uniref:hypothetical protein n=1 Tax=Stenotrophomonas sp. TaxID=69392 RepID=UPI003D6CBD74
MTEVSETQALEEKQSISIPCRSPDPMLLDLVLVANHGFGFGVTLTVGGVLVSGNVVSGRQYVQFILDEAIGNGVQDETVRVALHNRFKGYLDLYPVEVPDDQSTPTFIHLCNAKFYAPGSSDSIPSGEGVLWRGAITDVSGFFFGVLG